LTHDCQVDERFHVVLPSSNFFSALCSRAQSMERQDVAANCAHRDRKSERFQNRCTDESHLDWKGERCRRKVKGPWPLNPNRSELRVWPSESERLAPARGVAERLAPVRGVAEPALAERRRGLALGERSEPPHLAERERGPAPGEAKPSLGSLRHFFHRRSRRGDRVLDMRVAVRR